MFNPGEDEIHESEVAKSYYNNIIFSPLLNQFLGQSECLQGRHFCIPWRNLPYGFTKLAWERWNSNRCMRWRIGYLMKAYICRNEVTRRQQISATIWFMNRAKDSQCIAFLAYRINSRNQKEVYIHRVVLWQNSNNVIWLKRENLFRENGCHKKIIENFHAHAARRNQKHKKPIMKGH